MRLACRARGKLRISATSRDMLMRILEWYWICHQDIAKWTFRHLSLEDYGMCDFMSFSLSELGSNPKRVLGRTCTIRYPTVTIVVGWVLSLWVCRATHEERCSSFFSYQQWKYLPRPRRAGVAWTIFHPYTGGNNFRGCLEGADIWKVNYSWYRLYASSIKGTGCIAHLRLNRMKDWEEHNVLYIVYCVYFILCIVHCKLWYKQQ